MYVWYDTSSNQREKRLVRNPVRCNILRCFKMIIWAVLKGNFWIFGFILYLVTTSLLGCQTAGEVEAEDLRLWRICSNGKSCKTYFNDCNEFIMKIQVWGVELLLYKAGLSRLIYWKLEEKTFLINSAFNIYKSVLRMQFQYKKIDIR